ncbi:unnamed protein product [Owenia fusiformis]|uniref:Solute-binding protein family 3/N-terminal domain-containing protein n=1 Tax=Owenia fusiformis TaxID=6347 RepID=A0A8J1TID8_OWEFU|nr:unnamed protein product [Owenia fusiformis]
MNGAEGATGSTVNLAGGNNGGQVNSRLLLILIAVLGVVAIIGLILAAVALGRPTGTSVTVQPAGSGDGSAAKVSQSGKRIWSIEIGHDYGAFEYIDDEGYLQGFNFDLIKAVCDAADMDCRTVWDKYSNCMNSEAGEHSMGGQGLLDGWYDACMGWVPTIGRTHVFSFAQSYGKPTMAQFYVKNDDVTFNPSDITGKKIGFIDGWAYDEKCVAKQKSITGSTLDRANIVHVSSPTELIPMITNGKVDAVFTGEENMKTAVKDGIVKKSGGDISCMLGGVAVMARKDSSFIALWNEGFRKIKANGEFDKLCDSDKHSSKGTVDCVPSMK